MEKSRGDSLGTVFNRNTTIVKFNEFELFTGVASFQNGFERCSSLEEIKLAPQMGFASMCFDQCSKLKAITIPSAVTSIGHYALRRCTSLKTITSLPTTPPTWGSQSFDGTNPDVVYVPSASVAAYKSASGWSAYASKIQAIP